MSDVRAVERWSVHEVSLSASAAGNPFTDVEFGATFRQGHREVHVEGFHDGAGTFRVRFSPDADGEWTWRTRSTVHALDGSTGAFLCVPPSEGNRGPVRVRDVWGFEYADGTPYWQVGTTCYAWAHQPDELVEQTLATLADAPFNKLRMCVFPKDYRYNHNEPPAYPFEGRPQREWDFARFDPAFWRRFEGLVGRLGALGIEADLILFHPYDRWGFSSMGVEADDRYVRYAIARLSAYRNVWWSLANEFDFMHTKGLGDWDRLFRTIQTYDPHRRLRSIHNGIDVYDHAKPWVTHASIQSSDLPRVARWREEYRKPVVVDECRYEGNISEGWGNLTAVQLVHRFWLGTVCGGYIGHGETYLHPEEILWWSKGGVLHGESAPRLAFLRTVLESGPAGSFHPTLAQWDRTAAERGEGAEILIYFGESQPAEHDVELPDGAGYRADVLDAWGMTITPLGGVFRRQATIPLPGRPWIAVRLTRL